MRLGSVAVFVKPVLCGIFLGDGGAVDSLQPAFCRGRCGGFGQAAGAGHRDSLLFCRLRRLRLLGIAQLLFLALVEA